MRITAKYVGDLDHDKQIKIIEASGTSSHDSTYHLATKTHRISFKAPDRESADAMKKRIELTGIAFSNLEVGE